MTASPSNALSKRAREEEQEGMSADTQSQDEPSDSPICKRVRIHRVEVRFITKFIILYQPAAIIFFCFKVKTVCNIKQHRIT